MTIVSFRIKLASYLVHLGGTSTLIYCYRMEQNMYYYLQRYVSLLHTHSGPGTTLNTLKCEL